ncbi:MAG: hypothetical protein KG003_06000 [Bacteroidetes bacterium]|nr:hypothetical protein [Bacteroidota bacterium]
MRLLFFTCCILFLSNLTRGQSHSTFIDFTSNGKVGDFANVKLTMADTPCNFIFMAGPEYINGFLYFTYQCLPDSPWASKKYLKYTKIPVNRRPYNSVRNLGIQNRNYYATEYEDTLDTHYTIIKADSNGAFYEYPLELSGSSQIPILSFIQKDSVYYILKDLKNKGRTFFIQLIGDSILIKSEWNIPNLVAMDPELGSLNSFVAVCKTSDGNSDSFRIYRIIDSTQQVLDSFVSLSVVKTFCNDFGNFIFYFESSDGDVMMKRISDNKVSKVLQALRKEGIGPDANFWFVPVDKNDFMVVLCGGGILQKNAHTMYFTGWGELQYSKYEEGKDDHNSTIGFVRDAHRLSNGRFVMAVESYRYWTIKDKTGTYNLHESILDIRSTGIADFFDNFHTLRNAKILKRNQIQIMGNPICDVLKYESTSDRVLNSFIYNSVGVLAQTHLLNPGQGELDLSGLSPGIYLLRTEFGQAIKVLVQR